MASRMAKKSDICMLMALIGESLDWSYKEFIRSKYNADERTEIGQQVAKVLHDMRDLEKLIDVNR